MQEIVFIDVQLYDVKDEEEEQSPVSRQMQRLLAWFFKWGYFILLLALFLIAMLAHIHGWEWIAVYVLSFVYIVNLQCHHHKGHTPAKSTILPPAATWKS